MPKFAHRAALAILAVPSPIGLVSVLYYGFVQPNYTNPARFLASGSGSGPRVRLYQGQRGNFLL
jgi:hypothetical protein